MVRADPRLLSPIEHRAETLQQDLTAIRMRDNLIETRTRLVSSVRVLLMLDGDEAGRRAQARVATRLRDRCAVRVIGLPEGAQPDQLPEWRLRAWIGSATVGAERML